MSIYNNYFYSKFITNGTSIFREGVELAYKFAQITETLCILIFYIYFGQSDRNWNIYISNIILM